MARSRGGGHPRVCATRRSHADRRCAPPRPPDPRHLARPDARGRRVGDPGDGARSRAAATPDRGPGHGPARRDRPRRHRHVLRPRLRPRGRPLPVRGAGPRPRRPGRRDDPRPLLPGDDARADAGQPDPRPRALVVCGHRGEAARPLRTGHPLDHRWRRRVVPARREAPADPDDDGHGRRRTDVVAAPGRFGVRRGPAEHPREERDARPRRRRPRPAAAVVEAGRLRHVSRRPAAPSRDHQVRGQRRQRHRARPVPARRGPGRDARLLAGGRAPGAGRRRALVRGPATPAGRVLLRHRRRQPGPGLSRLDRREDGVERGGRRDRQARAEERVVDREHALPLVRRRRDRGQRERLHLADRRRWSPGP